jgi:hypothetical protein
MSWRVEFFVDEQKRAPVEEVLMGLPLGHKAKVLALVKMLEQEGPNLPFPYSSQVRGKLRELRTQQGKDKLRILLFRGCEASFHSFAWHREAKRQADGRRHSARRDKDAGSH